MIMWFRRDLRLADHPALWAAAKMGTPVIPVFIYDDAVAQLGAAAKWRLGASLAALDERLKERGSRLILRRGSALNCLQDLISETGAAAVHWTRLYDPEAINRDSTVKATLRAQGITAESFPGHLTVEPWEVATKSGTPFRVYTPFWKAVRDVPVSSAIAAPDLRPPDIWPAGDRLADWRLGAAMNRGAAVVARYSEVGEVAALDRLASFISHDITGYATGRDRLDQPVTSRLSAPLSLGEISPNQCWRAARGAMQEGAAGAEVFLKELAWRAFAYHLMYHSPEMLTKCWRPEWESFPWNGDADSAVVRAWQQGQTGVPVVDAAMRELYTTGIMHNRARMIVASFLTKHLGVDWRIGAAWFADCLTDWDPASNAMGWQWVAGCGPDAAPYFRVFNPMTQQEKFDPKGIYVRRWCGDGPYAQGFWDAIPRSWNLAARTPRRGPIVDLATGRRDALARYEMWKTGIDRVGSS